MKKFTRLLLLVCLAALWLNPVQAQHDKFIFTKLDGRALLSRTGGSTWLALQGFQPTDVKPGDQLKVEGNGRGELLYPDGTQIRIKNNASLTILRDGIQLKIGYAWLKVPRRNDIFKVFTPLGSCSVLGTSFDVSVDRFGKTAVKVFNGIVAVRAAEDERNRQLVLQAGMRTVLTSTARVDEKPILFSAGSTEASMASEWERRGLPPIRPEIDTTPTRLPSADELLQGETYEAPKEKKKDLVIIARQRAAFYEKLRQNKLKEDSVLGGRMSETEQMYKDGHNLELGQYSRPDSLIRNRRDLDREYANTRNRILRVQSRMRQTEIEMNAILKSAAPSSTQQKTVARLQSELVSLRTEHRALRQKLRELENFKR
jgi:hypothetical protein